eukprot:5609055-Amphidinium_carterae.1
MLSPYEFAMHYSFKQTDPPCQLGWCEDRARLTDKGRAKIESSARGTVCSLEHAEDYIVNEDGGSNWVPLPDCEAMQPFRRDWVMQQRKRPCTPVLLGMARPLSEEEQAQRLLLLFYPTP